VVLLALVMAAGAYSGGGKGSILNVVGLAPAARPTKAAAKPVAPAPLPARIVVTVYNGSDRLGLETDAVRRLTAAGCQAAAVPQMLPQTPLTAVFHVDNAAAAARVAGLLGLPAGSAGPVPAGLRPAAGGSGAQVVVVLGNDYHEQ
jgi:predicted amino acid-binding ACT domain protein